MGTLKNLPIRKINLLSGFDTQEKALLGKEFFYVTIQKTA